MSLGKLLGNQLKRDKLIITPRFEPWLLQNPELVVDPEIARWVAGELMKEGRDRSGSWSASGMTRCPRERTFQHLGVPQARKADSTKLMVFHDGHMRHFKWQALLMQAGIIDRVEVPFHIEELNTRCTVDAMGINDQWGRFGVEFKGANSYSFKKVIEEGPKEEHIWQIHAYMLASELDIWSLIYEDKNSNEWKEFTIRRDEEIIEGVISELSTLDQALKDEVLAEPLQECIDKKGKYSRCDFAYMCLKTDSIDEALMVGNKKIRIKL